VLSGFPFRWDLLKVPGSHRPEPSAHFVFLPTPPFTAFCFPFASLFVSSVQLIALVPQAGQFFVFRPIFEPPPPKINRAGLWFAPKCSPPLSRPPAYPFVSKQCFLAILVHTVPLSFLTPHFFFFFFPQFSANPAVVGPS